MRHAILGHDIESAVRVRQRLNRMADGWILDALVEDEVRALRAVTKHVTQEELEAAVGVLVAANKLVIMGTGHASVLVDLLTIRLRRS